MRRVFWITVVAVPAGVLWFVTAGWSVAVVASGSMRPAIRPGDVMIMAPARACGDRDIVTFRTPGRPMLHRIVGVDGAGRLITKGDANLVADAAPVPRSAVTGVAVWRVPYAGWPALWLVRSRR